MTDVYPGKTGPGSIDPQSIGPEPSQDNTCDARSSDRATLDDFRASLNRTDRDYPRDRLVHELFEQQVDKTPDAPAVLCEGEQLTFRQLNERANQLARYLRGRGIGPDRIVGVCLARCLEMEVTLLAILKAGGAYVPLDPDYPPDRLSLIVRETTTSLVLTQSQHVEKLAGCSAEVVCIDRQRPMLETFPTINVGKVAQLHNLAYVVFTSGSTGVPKGVMIEHGALLNRLWWGQEALPLARDDRVLQKTPYTFDVSVWELFWPMIAGVPLVFAKPGGHKDPGYLIDLIGRSGVTTLHFVPSMLEVFLQNPKVPSCRGLRRVLCSGEAMSRHLRQRFFERLPHVELHNLYGPTETAIEVSWWNCRQSADTPTVPIGRPIANTQLYILDPQRNPVAVGVPGELYIGGVQLARGYLNRPDLTAEQFVSSPFDKTGQRRLYKTGDLCRYLADGNIEFLGRLDHQVKIRGFRIELGEIESVLGGHAAVAQGVVTASEGASADKRLVAYVVLRPGTACCASQLREYLSQKLPEYMIPSAFVFLEALPLTGSGKVDRKALPAPPSAGGEGQAGYVPPQTPAQEVLCGIFAEVLGVEKAGIHDDFFELAGHSLLATKAIYRIHDRLKVDLPIPSLFENPTVARLAQAVERALHEGQAYSRAREISPVSIDGLLPMSYAQRRMWFLYEFEPARPLYNIPLVLTLRGPLHVRVLEESLNDIVARHDSLRTTFDARDGEPVQIIHPHTPQTLSVEAAPDLAGLELSDLVEHPTLKRETCCAFDLRQGPLLHMKLLHVREDEHVLVLTMHHIISDGWSMDVLLDELSKAYAARIQGQAPDLEPLPIRYADYALWQPQWLQGSVLEQLQNYWRQQLKGDLPVLELPTDYARSTSQRVNGRWETLGLGKALSDSIKQLSRQEGKTPFMTLLAAFQVLLHRYSGQEDILVGSPIANRTRKELEPLIGFFVNTLVLRGDLSGNPTFRQLLERVERVCLGAYAHQDLPFERLVDQLHPTREAGRNPLFEVMFVLGNAHGERMHLADLEVRCQEVSTDTAKFDLTLFVEERGGELVAIAEYRSDLFFPQTIERLLVHYRHLLESIVRAPQTPISDLSLLGEQEQRQLLTTWNQTERAYPQDRCVHRLFEDQASQTPEAAAVVYEDQVLTYRQLNERANQLAHYLQRQDLGPDRLVGVYLDRRPELIISLLAILKAGGAYVPLDRHDPSQRLAWMIEDTGLKALITNESLAGSIANTSLRLICLDRERMKIEQEPTGNPACASGSEDRAYVMYTSGSTGVPKGVEISHRGIVRLLFGVDYVDLGGRQSFLQLAPVSFDASTFEIWGALLHGHRCVLFPQSVPQIEKLGEVLQKYQIDCLWLTASLFNMVIEERPEILRGVRQLLTGGEALSVSHVRRALEQLPQTQLINGYGPTESTTFTCTYRIPRPVDERARSIPIGRPIGNTQVYILDDRMRPVPVGLGGQLYIGGAGLARGYWNRPELTAERFVSHPFDGTGQTRLYKTGDLCRYLADGNIEFLGRLDHQVKIRGFRIELGEIESVLGGHAAVAQGVVTAREDTLGEKRLVAYVVCRQESACSASQLREYLGQKLPEYMVPSAFVFLDALPLTASGKVDRKALPSPPSGGGESGAGYVPPQTPTQEALCGIFAEVLGVEKVGVEDNFFELGGHSLLATKAIYRINNRLRIDLSIPSLFENPTAARLAQVVEQALLHHHSPAVSTPITATAGPGPSVLSYAQERMWFLYELEPRSALYNISYVLHLKGPLHIQALEDALSDVIGRHSSLRTTFDTQEGGPLQVINPCVRIPLAVEAIDGFLPEGPDSLVEHPTVKREACAPFDLRRGPVLRAKLFRLHDQDHALVLTMHHIISDGWSMDVLFGELGKAYMARLQDRAPCLEPLSIQYGDYAIWQRHWFKGETRQKQLSYWQKRLKPPLTPLELPTDYQRPAVQTYRGKRLSLILNAALTRQLHELSRQEGKTLFMTLLAAFEVLLHRHSGQEDILVGSPIANRTRKELEPLIGFFVNTLALRGDLSGNPTFRELLGRVENACLGAYENQDLPFEQLVEQLGVERDPSRHPLFQVMFVLQSAEDRRLVLPDVEVECREVATDTAKFDLTLLLEEHGGELAVTAEYNTDLFAADTIRRLLGHYQRLLQGIVSSPDSRLRDLPLLGDDERAQIVERWNQTYCTYPAERCVHELFEEQVARTPDAVAVVYENRQLTYRQLNVRANQLAHYLRQQGIGPGKIVGVCVDRSLDMEIALLGVLKAGGAYVPLDPDYPVERLSLILRDTGTPLVITEYKYVKKMAGCSTGIFCVDRDGSSIQDLPGANLDAIARPDDLAYVIFTSGSTGAPKGVMIEHRAMLNQLWWMRDVLPLTESDRVLQKTAFTFDVSVCELFWPLIAGSKLVFAKPGGHRDPSYLTELIVREEITNLFFVPSMLEAFLQDPKAGTLGCLRRVICSGEALSCDLRERFFECLPHADLYNLYGPTEAAVHASWWNCRDNVDRPIVPIGRPVANTQLYILDPGLGPVPAGVPGELYIGGTQVARGYLNRPELTRERFVLNPFDRTGRSRLYRTGDLCRFLPDGNIEFLGRLDHQVKIRGFRVELGEVEAALAGHPGVRQAVVLAREDQPGDKRLVAHVVFSEAAAVGADVLREYLRQKLPEYMVPSGFVFLKGMPLTANGKIDRKALPTLGHDLCGRKGEYAAPQTATQKAVAEIFAEVLGLDKVGIQDNFFELGGHSLRATRAIYRIQSRLQIELPISALFRNPTVAELAHVIEQARGGGHLCTSATAILRVVRKGSIPASYAQRRMWFLHEVERDSPVYNIPYVLRMRGRLDIQALEQALNDLIQRHESLRTTFDVLNGEPVQVIHAHEYRPLPLETASVGPGGQGSDDVTAHPAVVAEARTAFDLRQGPLLRMRLFELDELDHVLVLTTHHSISDGWSMDVILKEFAAAYAARFEGRDPNLEPLSIQYADYTDWQKKWFDGEVRDKQLSYWQDQLKLPMPVLDLPTDYPRPAIQTYRGRQESLRLDAGLTQGVKTLSLREGKTLFMTLLAAFQVLLHRYTSQEEILVGSPIANRTRKELEPLVGFFVNTLALRSDMSGNPTCREFLNRVQEVCLGAYAHQDLPFEQLVDQLHLGRDASRTPLFQVMFVLQNAHDHRISLPGVEVECRAASTDTAKFDLVLFLEEHGQELVATAEYNTDLLAAATIRRLLGHYRCLLQGIVANPDSRLRDLPLLSEGERAQVLNGWNQTSREYPRDRCVHELFEDQVGKTPDAAALVHEDQQLTYRELNARANQLAHYLRRHGVRPDTLVGVYLERCPDLIVAILAILKAGGAYVPFNPGDPVKRLDWMVQDTGVTTILTQDGMVGDLPSSRVQTICLDRDWAAIQQEPIENPDSQIRADRLAYVMYTSGSTGQPKGVEIPHRGIVRLVFAVDYVDLRGEQTFLQLAPIGFDASTFEIWGALLHGHRCVLFPGRVPELDKLAEIVKRHRISCLWLTASLFNFIIDQRPSILKGVNQVLTGGEALSVDHVRRALESLPGTQLVNGYGPTENTTFTCCYHIPRQLDRDLRSIPIGRPISNTRVYILDGQMQAVPIGVPGELYIAGDGLARRYLNRLELTRERFVPNPFDETGQGRLYKTGDLCRHLPDSNIEFLGRRDDQVKIRGFRIELGEIGAAIGAHPSVRQAIVVAREDQPEDKRLIAYVVRSRKNGFGTEDLREHLRQMLPEYMIPSGFVFLEAMPLTANGKIDRKALPAPGQDPAGGTVDYAAPQTATQKAVAEMFAEVLRREKVGLHDNFFELGGHSLLAVQLFHKIQERFEASFPLATLFQAATVKQISDLVLAGKTGISHSSIVQIKSGGGDPPLFILPGVGGHSMVFSTLANRLGLDRPIYGLELRGLDGKTEPHSTIEDMASYFIDLIQTVQKRGPYHMVGYSLGGRIAFEMALQLTERGQQVGALVMIAATAPGYEQTSRSLLISYGLKGMNFLRLGAWQKWEYLVFKAGDVRRRIRRWQKNRSRRATASPYERSLLANVKRVERHALEAWRIYKPRARYPGKILLIRETNIDSPLYRSIIHGQAGWERCVTGEIETCEIHAGHVNILKEPYVDSVAGAISDYVRRTQDAKVSLPPGDETPDKPAEKDETTHLAWPTAPTLLTMPDGDMHVFLADIDKAQTSRSRYEWSLSSEERDRASRFVHALDRARFVARRGLLRELLSSYTGIDADQIRLQYSDTGRPSLHEGQNPAGLRFSLSTRGNLALYAFTCRGDVGIDLERAQPVANLLELAGQQLSGPEYELLCSLPESSRLEMFYTIWTCKEAYIKARGIIPLRQFTVSIGPAGKPELSADEIDPRQIGQWSFSTLPVGAGWHAALVARKGDMTLNRWSLCPAEHAP